MAKPPPPHAPELPIWLANSILHLIGNLQAGARADLQGGREAKSAAGADLSAAGFLHLAVVVDVWSRRAVDSAMANHPRAELVPDAPHMALDGLGRGRLR